MDPNQMAHQTSGSLVHHHWGYGNPTTADSSSSNARTTSWHPQPVETQQQSNSGSGRRAAKRAISESDDCDDVYSEGSSKDPCTSPNDGTSCCQMLSRKKRRGVIEKKRRDRINTSLTELKRLVPSAYEKQGSAKLEKAEILQMTVDHLKMLHAKGLDKLAYDPHSYAMDYHIIGFRECASEVARYLVTIEGMDIQDPLRLRLMSHLQCFVTQRELASKQAATATGAASTAWSYAPPPPPTAAMPTPNSPTTAIQHYPGPPAPSVANPVNLLHHHPPPHPSHPSHHSTPSSPSTIHHHSSHSTTNLHDPNLVHYGDLSRQPPAPYSTSTLTPLTSTVSTRSRTPLSYHSAPQYHNLNSYPTSTSSATLASNYDQNNTSSSNMKPYRPWGAEVAY